MLVLGIHDPCVHNLPYLVYIHRLIKLTYVS